MAGAVEEIIGREVPGRFAVEESTVVVGTAVSEILKNDPERVSWLLVNTGTTTAQVSFELSPGTPDAIPIFGDGGSLSVNVREDFVLTTHSLLGSVAVGTTTLRLTVIRRVSE